MIKINKKLDKISEYKPSKRTTDDDFIKLDWNECNLEYDDNFKNLLLSSLSTINFSEYPNINNDSLLYKLSKYCNVNIDNVQIFNGSDSALHYIFATFLDESSKVLIFYPNYNQIEVYIKLYTKNVVYSYIDDIFNAHIYNFKEIKNCDVIYISNPNNPTGFCLSPNVIEHLLKKYPNKLFIIDEAYYEFSKKSCVKLTELNHNVIVTRTFSKGFSLASIRLGYICANKFIIDTINKIRNTKEVNSFAQKIGEVVLDNLNFIENRIQVILENREKFQNKLDQLKIKYVKSQSNFVLLKLNNNKKIIDELLLNKILIRDRSMFEGLNNTIRITIGNWCDMERILKIIYENEYK